MSAAKRVAEAEAELRLETTNLHLAHARVLVCLRKLDLARQVLELETAKSAPLLRRMQMPQLEERSA